MGDAAKILDEWMTTSEAAAYARMSKRALLQHVAEGRLRPDARARPGFKEHRFRRSTIDRWLMGPRDGE